MKSKKILLSLGTAALVATPVMLAISCSHSGVRYKEFKFDTKVKLQTSRETQGNSTTKPTEVNVYNPNYNANAQKEIEVIKQNLSVENLNADFRDVLTNFYEAYEIENNILEIELERIRVLEKNPDGSFKIEVTYETETNLKDSNEQIHKKTINWTPKLTLIGKKDIKEIRNLLYNTKPGQNQNLDLKDLREVFFGKKDDDMDLEDKYDYDDKGIFDKIALLNKEYRNNSYLIGYEITLNDIFGQLGLKPRAGIDINTKFKVPSLWLNSLATIFVPNVKPDLNFTTKPLTQAELDPIFKKSPEVVDDVNTPNNEILDTLKSILANVTPEEETYIKENVSKLYLNINTAKNEYEVILEYGKIRKSPDMIVISPTTNAIV